MAITRDSRHKRRHTGGKRKIHIKKRKFECGRPAANTKLGDPRIHPVRCRGGNMKYRAIRLDSGNFSWGTEAVSRKTRVLDVVYNASNNELVRTKTLVKNCVVQIDATPFKMWYEKHYGTDLGRHKEEEEVVKSKSVLKKQEARRKAVGEVEPAIKELFLAGRLLACVSSRPGQCGRVDGYILEGKELDFYKRQLQAKKKGKK